MLSRIRKVIWSHTRNMNVMREGNSIRYEIPMYFEGEMESQLVSVHKCRIANSITVKFCVDNIEQDATPEQTQVSQLPEGEM